MHHEERGVIRIGDKTDHGGQVISASSGTIVMGKEAALQDDMTVCPRCKGQFPIKPDGAGAKHAGRSYAYHDDVAACGAKLITSLDPSRAGTSPSNANASSATVAGSVAFNELFRLMDIESDEALPNHDYAIVRANGNVEYGTTSASGHTHILSSTVASESIEFYI